MPEIREVFVITRLNQLFDIVDTREKAMDGFQRAHPGACVGSWTNASRKSSIPSISICRCSASSLAGAKRQPDEAGEVERLTKEIAALEAEAQKLKRRRRQVTRCLGPRPQPSPAFGSRALGASIARPDASDAGIHSSAPSTTPTLTWRPSRRTVTTASSPGWCRSMADSRSSADLTGWPSMATIRSA